MEASPKVLEKSCLSPLNATCSAQIFISQPVTGTPQSQHLSWCAVKASTINFQVGWLSLSATPVCQEHKLWRPFWPSRQLCCGCLMRDHRTGQGESRSNEQPAECAADTAPSLGEDGWELGDGRVVTQTLDSFQSHYCKIRVGRFLGYWNKNCAWWHRNQCVNVCELWHLSTMYWHERKQVDVSDLSTKPLNDHSCKILCLHFDR